MLGAGTIADRAVVRPGWVAFLPSAAPMHLLAGMAWALGGFVRIELGTLVYDLAGALAQGLPVLDEHVQRLAAQTGRVLRKGDAELTLPANGLGHGLLGRADGAWLDCAGSPLPSSELKTTSNSYRLSRPSASACRSLIELCAISWPS